MNRKFTILISFAFSLFLSINSQAQWYTTTGGEMVFSWSQIQEFGADQDTRMRWSPVFNIGTYVHYDAGKAFGLFSGIDIKNIGFIYQQDTGNGVNKVIQRTYNLGIPIAVKLGNLDKFFIYAGYQFELPFHYKYKRWDSSDRSGAKTKFTQFFSNATPTTMNTLFAGIQFYGGLNLKFRWYLDNFVNPDYIRNGEQLNEGLEVQVFSLSIVSNLFNNTSFYYKESVAE